MPAYLIVETDITDPEQYEQYKAASPGAIAAHGGRFVVRGGDLAVLDLGDRRRAGKPVHHVVFVFLRVLWL